MKVEDIMHLQDLSQNRRIARLAQLTRELEQSRTPEDTLRILERGFAEVDGFVASLLLSTRGLSPGHYRVVGAQLKDEPLSDLPSQAKEEPGPVRRGGILGAIISRREPQLVQDVDWSRDPFFRETLSGYTSVMAIPLTGDRLPMTWGIALKKPPQQFTASDLEEAVERVALVGALLENQMLASELARANEQIDRDARRVGELQRALLRHLCRGSPDWRSRRVTRHWAAQAATSTTYSLSTNARTIELMLARRRAGGASSSATSKDTAWRPRSSWRSCRPCCTHIPPGSPGPRAC